MSKAEDPARVDEEEEEEEEDLSELVSEKLLVAEDAVKAMEAPKPFAAFGSYRQRHGEIEGINVKAGMSSEAPAKLMPDHPPASADAMDDGEDDRISSSSMPVSIPRPPGDKAGSRTMRRKVVRNYRWRDAEREEAWERKREQQQMEEEEENRMARAVGRSVSDCGLRRTGSGGISAAAAAGKSRFRARSLTDEDLDELRGSIDLGFGFSNQADPELWNTLPALELCYAISQQYHNKGSPVSNSTPEDEGSVVSEGSPTSSSWTISSPGDHPQQVKTRLRHWAQAVACTIRQNYQQELY